MNEPVSGLRAGHGYDVHRLVSGRDLIIGGVKIPYGKGLDGHSDADVLIHAALDALLGAAGLRDIGFYFPDSSPDYLGISSLTLASRVSEMLGDAGFAIVNLDCTVIAQAPKLSGYIPEMQARMAEALGTCVSRVNIKATTEERLGFTGSGRGIAAHAVCLLEKVQ